MKTLLVLFLFFVSTYGQAGGLIERLKFYGFTEFAGYLEINPDILCRFTERNDVTVWAPINGADDPASSAKGRLRVRDGDPATLSQQGSTPDAGTTAPAPAPAKARIRKRGPPPPLPPSNFLTLRTFLNDSRYVNLGDDQPGRIVSNYATGLGLAKLQATSGTGGPVDQIFGPYKYDKGIIYGVQSYFTLPKPLLESLTTVGLTEFRDEIVSQGFKEKLSKTPGVTIFATRNGTSGKIDIPSHVITNGFVGYLPELYRQSSLENPVTTDSGIPIRVTFKDGNFYVNGVCINRPNIIVKNGVVHEIDKPLS